MAPKYQVFSVTGKNSIFPSFDHHTSVTGALLSLDLLSCSYSPVALVASASSVSLLWSLYSVSSLRSVISVGSVNVHSSVSPLISVSSVSSASSVRSYLIRSLLRSDHLDQVSIQIWSPLIWSPFRCDHLWPALYSGQNNFGLVSRDLR